MNHKNNEISDGREVALQALYLTQKQGGWSDGVLKKLLLPLDSREGALATRLCFGVLQNRGLLDFYLSHFSKIPLKRMELQVVQILRLGAYQILFLDKIPPSAAVDSAVKLTKKHCKNQRASGMVNGILRNLVRNQETLPEIPQENPLEALSVLYSHPLWLVEQLARELPLQEVELCLQENNTQPPISAMINTVISSTQEVTASLEKEGVSVTPHPWLDHCIFIKNTGNIEKLTAFQEGLFYIQDPASRLAALCGGVLPGQSLLDTCAAPGGKSMALAIAMENQGRVISCDLHPHKKKLIQSSATRLKLDCISPETANATEYNPSWEQSFDLVLVDAPCSGLGVIAKKPDIRYKEEEPLKDLPQVQKKILQNVANYTKPGGVVVYSTCTILRRENQDVVDDFLSHHPQFSLEPFSLPFVGDVPQGFLTLWPHKHQTDGFFMAKFRRST